MLSPLLMASDLPIGSMIYYIVIFLILMYLIKIFAWKPLNKILKERSEKISNDIDSAEKSRQDAEKLAQQRQDALASSHTEASTIISNAKEAGQKQQTQIVDDAQAEAQQIKDAAHKSIEQERKDVLANSKNDVADLSIEIASKIIKKELNADDQKALINSYIERLGK